MGRTSHAEKPHALCGVRKSIFAAVAAGLLLSQGGMPTMNRLLACMLLFLTGYMSDVQAQGLDVGLVSGNDSALPIATVPMPYQGAGTAPDTDVAEVIRNDL